MSEEVCPDCGNVHIDAQLIEIERFDMSIYLKGMIAQQWLKFELSIFDFDSMCEEILADARKENEQIPYFAVAQLVFSILAEDCFEEPEDKSGLSDFPSIELQRDRKDDA